MAHDIKANRVQVKELENKESARVVARNILQYLENYEFEDKDLVTKEYVENAISNLDIDQLYWGSVQNYTDLNVYIPDPSEDTLALVRNELALYWFDGNNWNKISGGGSEIEDTDELPEGLEHLYFTALRAIASKLDGYSKAGSESPISSSDSIIEAIGKLEKGLDNRVEKEAGKGLFSGKWEDLTNRPAQFPPAPHTHTIGDITGLQSALNNKVDKESGKGLSENDYTDTDKNKLSDIESKAQKNVQTDWDETDTNADSFLKNKPTQVNFNIYNHNKANKITLSTTTKTSIIVATTGIKSLPSYALNDSYIGALSGKFNNSNTARNVTLEFTIGNITVSTSAFSVNASANDLAVRLDYEINFPVAREANLSGVLMIGNQSFIIDLDINNTITNLNYDIKATLTGGTLTVNSSYLHRNYN